MKRAILAVIAVAGMLLAAGPAAQAEKCDTWNAASPAQHHYESLGGTDYVDVVGGHGYGSGFHDSAHHSTIGKYGDPNRTAAEGGYVQGSLGGGAVNFHADFFGPLDETNNTHVYDTSGGACVGVAGTVVGTGEIYIPTGSVN